MKQRGKTKKLLKEIRTTPETSGTMLKAPMFKSYLSGVPDEEDKKKNHEKILEEIIVENFPNMGKEIVTQVQETQRVPNRINPRRNTPRHTLNTLTKIKHKEQTSRKGKTTNNTQRDSHKDNCRSFNRNTSVQEGMARHT